MKMPGFTAQNVFPAANNLVVGALGKRDDPTGLPGGGFRDCIEGCMDKTGMTREQCRAQCTFGAGGGGGGDGGGGSGWGETQECALKFYKCTAGCQAVPFPGNLICEGVCIADRISCKNPF